MPLFGKNQSFGMQVFPRIFRVENVQYRCFYFDVHVGRLKVNVYTNIYQSLVCCTNHWLVCPCHMA